MNVSRYIFPSYAQRLHEFVITTATTTVTIACRMFYPRRVKTTVLVCLFGFLFVSRREPTNSVAAYAHHVTRVQRTQINTEKNGENLTVRVCNRRRRLFFFFFFFWWGPNLRAVTSPQCTRYNVLRRSLISSFEGSEEFTMRISNFPGVFSSRINVTENEETLVFNFKCVENARFNRNETLAPIRYARV